METITKEILLTSWVVKKKIASRKSLDSQAQFEHLRLKCETLEENSKNKTSGRSRYKKPHLSFKK